MAAKQGSQGQKRREQTVNSEFANGIRRFAQQDEVDRFSAYEVTGPGWPPVSRVCAKAIR